MHKHYAKLPWKDLLAPSIKLAREGFEVTEDLVHFMNLATEKDDFLTNDLAWAIDFAPNGTRLGLGDIITRKRYANTLEAIANQGPDVFYTGRIAESLVKTVRDSHGIFTIEDMRNYTIAVRDVEQIDYRGVTVHSTTAPSSGAGVLALLKILDGYDDFFTSDGNLNLSTHRLDEAMRFAYGQVSCLN